MRIIQTRNTCARLPFHYFSYEMEIAREQDPNRGLVIVIRERASDRNKFDKYHATPKTHSSQGGVKLVITFARRYRRVFATAKAPRGGLTLEAKRARSSLPSFRFEQIHHRRYINVVSRADCGDPSALSMPETCEHHHRSASSSETRLLNYFESSCSLKDPALQPVSSFSSREAHGAKWSTSLRNIRTYVHTQAAEISVDSLVCIIGLLCRREKQK